MAEIGFIGAGVMAEAILKGMLKKGLYKPGKIAVYDVRPERMGELSSALRVGAAASLEELARKSRAVVLAVKPDKVPVVLAQAKEALAGKLIISIAAGVSLGNIQSVAGMDAGSSGSCPTPLPRCWRGYPPCAPRPPAPNPT